MIEIFKKKSLGKMAITAAGNTLGYIALFHPIYCGLSYMLYQNPSFTDTLKDPKNLSFTAGSALVFYCFNIASQKQKEKHNRNIEAILNNFAADKNY
ncbi:MAG: hypothetical protein V1660_02090 [archaeon]